MRLANLPTSALDRLSRNEHILRRQARNTLESLRRGKRQPSRSTFPFRPGSTSQTRCPKIAGDYQAGNELTWWDDLKINALEIARGAGNGAVHALTRPIEQPAAAMALRTRARALEDAERESDHSPRRHPCKG